MEVSNLEKKRNILSWSELPEGFKNLLRRSYEEYKEVLYDPSLHPLARKIPTWEDWLFKHDIVADQ